MDNEKSILIKEEQTNEMCPEPTPMFPDDPLGVYWFTDHISEDSMPNFGWDENENNDAVVNTLLHTIMEAESVCCPPPLLVPKKELFPNETLGISCLTDFIKEDPELNLEADETENYFLEDPLNIEDRSLQVKQELELKIHTAGSGQKVVASSRCIQNSTRVIQNSGRSCNVSFGETVVQEFFLNELEIRTEGSTCLTMFDTHTQGIEAKEEKDESLFVGRLKCTWRENEIHNFICNFCLQSFSSKYRLIMHVFNHMDDLQPPSHVCRCCGEIFSSEIGLKMHLKMNDVDQAPYSGHKVSADCICKRENIFVECDKQTNIQSSPQFKSKILRAAGTKSHKCNVCGKSFTQLGNLKIHSLTHTGEKPHKCNVCGKSFTHSGNHKRHSLMHTGAKPHKCNVCGKSFTLSSSLKTHALIHTGLKPHKCKVCGKYFTQLGNLKTHSLMHTGEKRHKCHVCGKSFTRLDSIKKHELIHTGMRPHKCKVCGKSFTSLWHLKTHSLIHTGVKSHKCNVCGKSFTRLDHLRRHASIHTGI